jgi:hypothetical protein
VYFGFWPSASQERFEAALLHRRPPILERLTFDWQITPFRSLVHQLENDFQGAFELEDLEPHPEAWARVRNRRLGSCYPHDFPPAEPCSPEHIAAHYEHFRSRVDVGVDRFRKHLLTRGPYLYVFRRLHEPEPIPREDLRRLLALLRSRSPEHQCELLYVEEGSSADDWSDEEWGVHRRTVERTNRTGSQAWRGHDASWASMLAEFPLTLHNVQIVRRSA